VRRHTESDNVVLLAVLLEFERGVAVTVEIAVALGSALGSEHQNLPTHISELNNYNQSFQLCENKGCG
jgi:hypothetical protein